MGLNCVTTVKPRPGTRAASDGFIVLKLIIAPDKVIHRGLAAGHHAQRTNQSVACCLADFSIPRDHRRRIGRVQHRAFRHHNVNGAQTPFIQWDIRAHQRAEHIKHNCAADSFGRVVVARVLQ